MTETTQIWSSENIDVNNEQKTHISISFDER